MPLSEHEQRVLEQLENAMEVEDPKFATAMRGSSTRARARRRLLLGGAGLLIGLVMVVVGVASGSVPAAVLGFLLMIASGALAATPPRTAAGPLGTVDGQGRTRPRAAKAKQVRKAGTFMQRLERRWDQRRDDNRGWGG